MDFIVDNVKKCLDIQKNMECKDEENTEKIERFKENKISKEVIDNLYEYIYNDDWNKLNIYNDLEIFKNYDGSTKETVFDILDKTKLHIGRYNLKIILNNPLLDYNGLCKRKKELENVKNNMLELEEDINEIVECENDILWLLNKTDENEESIELYETLYFKMSLLEFMNDNELFLNIYYIYVLYIIPLVNVVMPIFSYVIPFILLKIFRIPVNHNLYNKVFKNVIDLSKFEILNSGTGAIAKYGGILFMIVSYLQTCYFCYKDSSFIYEVSNTIHKKINNIYKFVKVSINLNDKTYKYLNKTKLCNPLKELENELFEKEPYILSDKGKILRVFKILRDNRYIFNNIILNTGKIDSYLSILRLKTEYNMCVAEYLNNKEAKLLIKGVYHPHVKNSIKNNTYLNKKIKNMLITGANGSGKSTYIKGVSLNVLLSQTLGVCFSKKIKLTPFTYINTYLNLADSLGKESLFQAELLRMLENINIIKGTDRNVYLGIDEIFSSTNYLEATSGGYAICKEFGRNKNLISIISTHLKYLTNLEKDTKKFKNYKFIGNVIGEKIKYNYKLCRGASDQTFALKILNDYGYNKLIIKDAEDILQKIAN